MPFLILSIILQVALVIHIVRTGRPTMWIWIVVMLPLAGSIAYLILEVLPELANSRAGRRATRRISEVANRDRDFNRAISRFEQVDSVENAMKLANELLARRQYADAKTLYAKALKGVHATDPLLMLGLARAEFGLGNHQATRELLDALIEHNPDFKDADAHLIYARTLEALGSTEAAFHEYEALRSYYPGPEAKVRFAALCRRCGRPELSRELLQEVLNSARVSGRHYASLYRDWIRQAEADLES